MRQKISVERVKSLQNRKQLERDTAVYFERLTPAAAEEETRLGAALAGTARDVDVDSGTVTLAVG